MSEPASSCKAALPMSSSAALSPSTPLQDLALMQLAAFLLDCLLHNMGGQRPWPSQVSHCSATPSGAQAELPLRVLSSLSQAVDFKDREARRASCKARKQPTPAIPITTHIAHGVPSESRPTKALQAVPIANCPATASPAAAPA